MTDLFRLYRLPLRNEFIVVGADTSEGGDLSAGVFKSAVNFDSFMVLSGNLSSAEFAPLLYRGCKFINLMTGMWPYLGIERNMGQAVINYFVDKNYPNLYKQEVFDATTQDFKETIGWYTTAGNRRKMLDELSLEYNDAIEQQEVRVYDQLTVGQLLTFIRNKASGKPEAEKGCYDDLVMAEAIAHQLALVAPIGVTGGIARVARPQTKAMSELLRPSAKTTYDLEKLKTKTGRARGWKSI
jgi:hypothetical protein